MKICRFNENRVGLVDGDRVVDVTETVEALVRDLPPGAGDPLVRVLPALREMTGLDALAAVADVAAIRLETPVMPEKILAAPVNYRAHVQEMIDSGMAQGHQLDIAKAGLFVKTVASLAAPADGVQLRFPDRRTDQEVELVIVIGTGGRDIAEARALDAVAGYTLGLDITLRGTEDRSLRKSIDSYTVVGPWLVLADDGPDPDNLDIMASVNGTVRQQANTSELVWNVARIVAFASTYVTLRPGDLIFTGTPQGVGPIVAGDRIRAEGSWIGHMEIAVTG